MSPDPDGDSQMLSSSPDVSDVETPPAAALSPPSSQSRTMPIVSAGIAQLKGAAGGGGGASSIANSNGKRPLNTISNGLDDPEDGTIGNTASSSSATSTRSKNQQALNYSPPSQQTKTHAASGYSWSRAEDEPGWAWLNPKAADEAARAWETLVHRDAMVKNRFGDVFELARRAGPSPSLAG